ncbi:MAG: Cu(I)-responsive transcriptional regulator [Boseongicola sp. SB0677_bin_26]|nr:Cu(I)-responsive transcriptional regulator [Boseongicola sp. SB0665_bin_10]MYG27488.1 Cu(I)-responsive transcriptional regulator [Boseongicola sp. SB0677_bin_26]
MNIGEAAKAAGLPVKTIRYYEEIGLVRPARSENGYRVFAESDLHKLNFLGRSRALGFSIEDCRALLALYEDGTRSSSEVREIAERHLTDIEGKITDLQSLRDTLAHLVASCAGDERPDCPILDNLSGD